MPALHERSVNLYCEPFQDQAPLLEKRAIYRMVGERETGEATHNDFCRAVHLFWVYFVLFSPVSFLYYIYLRKFSLFFFQK